MHKRPTRNAAAAKRGPATPSTTPGSPDVPVAEQVEAVLLGLKRLAPKRTRHVDADSERPSPDSHGVPMAKLQTLARRHAPSHALAAALWEHGGHDARVVAAFVEDPACVTPAQMDAWCREFDSWDVCDAACFHLFDRVLCALDMVSAWSREPGEFQKRAAFALLAGVALHDDARADADFARFLPTIEAAAVDGRTAIKKAVGSALKAIGGRSGELNAAAVAVALRLRDAPEDAPRWIGTDALRALTGPAAAKRLAARTRSSNR